MINLEEKTLNELKELAKENNIKNISKLKKRRFNWSIKSSTKQW